MDQQDAVRAAKERRLRDVAQIDLRSAERTAEDSLATLHGLFCVEADGKHGFIGIQGKLRNGIPRGFNRRRQADVSARIRDAMEANLLSVWKGKVALIHSALKESDAAILGASSLAW